MVVTKERKHKGETVPTSEPEGKKRSKDQHKKQGPKQKEGKKGSKGKEDSKGASKDNQKKRGHKK
eukprot:scaffold1529_cov86-Cylindrotheca_fusiformis.AAC.6